MRKNRRNRSGPAAALFFLAVLSLAFQAKPGAAVGPKAKENLVIGVKIYDYSGSFPRLFEEWDTLGINTAFVSAALASNPEFRGLAQQHSVAVFIIFPVFFNAEELAKRPDLFAVTADGEKASDD